MDVTFHIHPGAAHQEEHARLLEAGLRKHGLNPRYANHDAFCNSDVSIIWSWKQPNLIKAIQEQGKHVLVMERGYLPDRMHWTSLSWDGMNGLGKCPPAPDKDRWNKYFKQHLKPWVPVKKLGDYALVIGQVKGDPTLYGLDIHKWYDETIHKLAEAGYKPMFREHPWVTSKGRHYPQMLYKEPEFCRRSGTNLTADFSAAKVCVTYSSNTAVEAVLNGIPTIAMHPGSVAYSVAAHDFSEKLRDYNRQEWCNNLSYRQWNKLELEDGRAWDFMKTYLK